MVAPALQPTWVLHRRPFGDNGAIAECFGLESGRQSVLVKGLRRKARGGSLNGLVQPFVPLMLLALGRGELKSLRSVESVGASITLTGTALLSGLYLNELLLRLLPKHDTHPALFARYGETLESLKSGSIPEPLRRFELTLLGELGYEVVFDVDAAGDTVEPDNRYLFDPYQGWLPRVFDAPNVERANVFSGKELLAMASWWRGGDSDRAMPAAPLKRVCRLAIEPHLGQQPLRSRELARQQQRTGAFNGQTACEQGAESQ